MHIQKKTYAVISMTWVIRYRDARLARNVQKKNIIQLYRTSGPCRQHQASAQHAAPLEARDQLVNSQRPEHHLLREAAKLCRTKLLQPYL